MICNEEFAGNIFYKPKLICLHKGKWFQRCYVTLIVLFALGSTVSTIAMKH